MTKSRQFWALFRFLARIDPILWIIPLTMIGLPLLFNEANAVPGLFPILSAQLPLVVGILGVWALSRGIWAGGYEFLLTRAVDRPVVYRVRAALFYVAIVLVPLASLAHSLREPELKVMVIAKSAVEKCLVSVPGSTRVPDPSGSRGSVITMPRGNVMVNSWRLWIFAVTAFGVRVLLAMVYPLKHRVVIFCAVFLVCVLAPLFEEFQLQRADGASRMVLFFFSFVAHQTAFWIVTAIILILGQLWCEHRFCRLDHSN
jgi:hypothetical protein